MVGHNVTTEQLVEAAKQASVKMAYEPYETDRGLRFRLAPLSDHKRKPHHRFPFHRRSASMFHTERRVSAVCWHGHREFFRALFVIAPDARIYTALLQRHALSPRYWSAENFEDSHKRTAQINIGSQAFPVTAAEACFCEDRDGAELLENLQKAHVRSIKEKELTSECWLIQFRGLEACTSCEALETPECGGPEIRKTLLDEKGHEVPLGRVVA